MNNKHLKLSKLALTVAGMWPSEFYQKSHFLQSCYIAYTRTLKSYFFIMSCSQWLQLLFIATSNNVDELLENLGVSLLYTINIMKIWICSSSSAAKLIKHIYKVEERIFSGSINNITRRTHCK